MAEWSPLEGYEDEMQSEIATAANFLTHLVKCQFGASVAERFSATMVRLFHSHFVGHWHPTQPERGSGFRCVRINGKMDPIVDAAGRSCGIEASRFRAAFPCELTLWVDPGDVSYRIGEDGSVCSLFDRIAHPHLPTPSPTQFTVNRFTPSPPVRVTHNSAQSPQNLPGTVVINTTAMARERARQMGAALNGVWQQSFYKENFERLANVSLPLIATLGSA